MGYLLPDAFPETLRVCLDDAPQTSFEDVAATIHEDLGRPVAPPPLSYANILKTG